VSSNRLKKVQGKKKRDNATKMESFSQDDSPVVENPIPEDEASANLLSTKDDDVIF
jgi:V-type H+-transporting ATPase subunit D